MSFTKYIPDAYSILHTSNSDVEYTEIENVRDIWSENKAMWFSHESLPSSFIWSTTRYHNSIHKNISLILQHDQLYRHPYEHITEKMKAISYKFATHLAFRVLHSTQYDELQLHEKVFLLLTIRHNKSLKMKEFVLKKVYNEIERTTENNNILYRFLSATIWDIHTFKQNTQGYAPENVGDINTNIDFKDIIEPPKRRSNNFSRATENKYFIEKFTENITQHASSYDTIAVSISGGVDSMVCSYIANKVCNKLNKKLILLHICYNNRDTIDKELSMLNNWANTLGVDLYIRKITEITRSRDTKFRRVYEDITRRIRFSFYQYFKCPVILGHNKDDTFENIFSNLSRNINFNNLFGMKSLGIESDVPLLRPLLTTMKERIIEYADNVDIPHLCDSTPKWSNRGKTRDILIPAIDNFNPHILNGLSNYVEYVNFLEAQWNQSFQTWVTTDGNITKNGSGFVFTRDEFFDSNSYNLAFWIKLWYHLELDNRPSNKCITYLISLLRYKREIVMDLTKECTLRIENDKITLLYRN